MKNKVKVVIGQLGSPKTTSTKDVREYLREFLGDPRVVDINPTLWKIILNLFVLPFRPRKSAEAYKRIEKDGKFPLIEHTKEFAHKMKPHLDENIELNYAFLLSDPRPKDIFEAWNHEDEKTRAKEVLVIPQFPQYSEATIASVFDGLGKTLEKQVNIPTLTLMDHFHNSKAFIDGSVRMIRQRYQSLREKGKNPDHLMISFHGIPLRRWTQKKDVYYKHCYETYKLIKDRLEDLNLTFHYTFQSRFGSEQWLGPDSEEYACELAKNGAKNILIYCPSFTVDCLETDDEIGNELVEAVEEVGTGTHVYPVKCLNSDDQWSKDFAHFINTHVNGSRQDKVDLYYYLDPVVVEQELPVQVEKSPPLSDHAKTSIKIIFLTLFLDLIGFSIIFPMFPALAKHYLAVDGDNTFLKLIFNSIETVTNVSSKSMGMSPIVLFGGVLGALYSALQFIAAPFWGSLSDRIGRKPVLMISLTGLFLSYVLWIFSGSFTLLILARFIGGIMGGNISTATAVVADVTETSNRSKGMAFVGIAFAMGFIFGPAIGGILSMWDLSSIYPATAKFGVNPFSLPAIFAAVLALFNIYYIWKMFTETLPEDKRGKGVNYRSSNPLSLLKPLPYRNVNLTNWSYFVFLTAFSGMEFTLTFLAVERLSYTPLQNGYMFIYIGFLIAMVQGGYVRRKANLIGEKKMAIQGLVSIMPGLLIISYAQSSLMLYAGLFFLSIGSAMAIPTLTSLVSIHTPTEDQGRSLGIFRSLGAFGRVVGPLLACIIYWKYNSSVPYIVGTVCMIFPIMILSKVNDKQETASSSSSQVKA